MTAKIVKGSSFSGAVGYMLSKKEKAEILKAEGVRMEPKELTVKSFELQASMHPNIRNPVWHISLNFSQQDKDRLTNQKMVQIAETYMQKMGINNTQYLIVRHHDREHPHIHLCINRIDNNGKLIPDKNEKFRSTKICRELTKAHGLYFAAGKENVNRERLIGNDKTKYEIYDALKRAIPKSNSWEGLEKQLKKEGITFQFKTAGDTDKIQGIIFEKDGLRMSGSKVDRACSFSKIDREIKDNALETLHEAERQIDNILNNQISLTDEAAGAIDSLFAYITDSLGSFLEPAGPHYDATLADFLRMLRARKLARMNRVRISRVRF